MALRRIFCAEVVYQLHSDPPYFGLYNPEMGYTEVHLGALGIYDKEAIDKLCEKRIVVVTCAPQREPRQIYWPMQGIKDVKWNVLKMDIA